VGGRREGKRERKEGRGVREHAGREDKGGIKGVVGRERGKEELEKR
jgi:hypothetical protein